MYQDDVALRMNRFSFPMANSMLVFEKSENVAIKMSPTVKSNQGHSLG